jgi:TolB protein
MRKGAIFILFFILLHGYDAWGKVYLDIDAPTFQQFVIAVPDFQPLSAVGQQQHAMAASISDNLSNRLRSTGFFTVINKKAYIEDQNPSAGSASEEIRFADWTVIGTEYLIKGSFQYQGSELILNCRLYDVVKAELIVEKKYTGKNDDINVMLRKFAGEVLFALTGEGGIFTTRIAFIVKKGNKYEIFSVNFDGSDLIMEKEGKSVLMSPRWSPDGRHLSFTSFDDGNPDFYVKDMLNSSIMKIASFKGINLSGGWSPDSKKVLLTLSKDGNEEIYIFDFGNKFYQRLTNDFSIDVSPAWSPDGSKIAFVSNRSGSPQIYIMDADGNNVRRLTAEGNYNTSPSWSPKGDKIAFEGRAGGGRFQIFTIGADGENLKQLTFDGGESKSPSWSPDGRYIAISRTNSDKKKICIMNANGSNSRVLHEASGDGISPAWSPFLKSD